MFTPNEALHKMFKFKKKLTNSEKIPSVKRMIYIHGILPWFNKTPADTVNSKVICHPMLLGEWHARTKKKVVKRHASNEMLITTLIRKYTALKKVRRVLSKPVIFFALDVWTLICIFLLIWIDDKAFSGIKVHILMVNLYGVPMAVIVEAGLDL